ncbi:uncharacterized protein LOC126611537 isoform X2 [Malus sylvestris]|uniref:uncharacterized protein LOC126611537 isoform X2 n=1 Tax=Malus sylvestris TaxID=3752 RepID=UPI0021AB9F6A|nr:uncharacterized protein LOC126611537 isoform X2 [Malus sylvestris]
MLLSFHNFPRGFVIFRKLYPPLLFFYAVLIPTNPTKTFMRLYSPSLAKWVFFKSPHFSWLSYRVIFLQKQLISLGTRHISNFYLDWVTVDFSVRMDKVHEGFHFSSAVLLFCFCHFTCVSFCESRTQNEEGSGSEAGVIGKGFSSIWLLDELVFCSTSSLKTSVDSWLPRKWGSTYFSPFVGRNAYLFIYLWMLICM